MTLLDELEAKQKELSAAFRGEVTLSAADKTSIEHLLMRVHTALATVCPPTARKQVYVVQLTDGIKEVMHIFEDKQLWYWLQDFTAYPPDWFIGAVQNKEHRALTWHDVRALLQFRGHPQSWADERMKALADAPEGVVRHFDCFQEGGEVIAASGFQIINSTMGRL